MEILRSISSLFLFMTLCPKITAASYGTLCQITPTGVTNFACKEAPHHVTPHKATVEITYEVRNFFATQNASYLALSTCGTQMQVVAIILGNPATFVAPNHPGKNTVLPETHFLINVYHRHLMSHNDKIQRALIATSLESNVDFISRDFILTCSTSIPLTDCATTIISISHTGKTYDITAISKVASKRHGVHTHVFNICNAYEWNFEKDETATLSELMYPIETNIFNTVEIGLFKNTEPSLYALHTPKDFKPKTKNVRYYITLKGIMLPQAFEIIRTENKSTAILKRTERGFPELVKGIFLNVFSAVDYKFLFKKLASVVPDDQNIWGLEYYLVRSSDELIECLNKKSAVYNISKEFELTELDERDHVLFYGASSDEEYIAFIPHSVDMFDCNKEEELTYISQSELVILPKVDFTRLKDVFIQLRKFSNPNTYENKTLKVSGASLPPVYVMYSLHDSEASRQYTYVKTDRNPDPLEMDQVYLNVFGGRTRRLFQTLRASVSKQTNHGAQEYRVDVSKLKSNWSSTLEYSVTDVEDHVYRNGNKVHMVVPDENGFAVFQKFEVEKMGLAVNSIIAIRRTWRKKTINIEFKPS